MNIVSHIAIGIIGTVITNEPLFLIGSVLPDIALLPNEITNGVRYKKFNKWNVRWKFLYDISHSLFFVVCLYWVNPLLCLGAFIHVLIDVPFHSSTFRWKPFLINRYKTKKKALLLSGGMDSIACAYMEKDFDCVYVNYKQSYHHKEFPCAIEVAAKLGKELIVIKREWKTDIQNRNYYLISEIKRLGYDEVIIGSRNLIPMFDNYKDSNWFNLKVLQYLLKIYVNMPIVGMFKWQVKNKIPNGVRYYSTELSK